MNDSDEVVIKPDKGIKGGSCNLTACQRPGASWFNKSTKKYYCADCASEINWPGGRADCMALYGVPLLCEEDKDQDDATLPPRERDVLIIPEFSEWANRIKSEVGKIDGIRIIESPMINRSLVVSPSRTGLKSLNENFQNLLKRGNGYKPSTPRLSDPLSREIAEHNAAVEAKRKAKLDRKRGTSLTRSGGDKNA